MILLKILDVKDTMTGLLLQNDYDDFYLEEAKVTTYTKMQISGFRNMRWYDSEEREELSVHLLWKEIKPVLFSCIKGKKTPDSFQISLRAPEHFQKAILGEDNGRGAVDFFLHFRFEKEELSAITGCFHHEFTMEKGAEYDWDRMVKNLFRKKGISYEESS